MINIFQPSLGEEELLALKDVFASNWIGKGQQTDEFEASFARYIGVDRKHLRSISCCTEGLFQSMKLIDLQAGDEVILPTISFVAAANAILDAQGIPVFTDVDPDTLNITLKDIKEQVTKKTKAVMLIHYGGHPCEMDEIMEFCASKGIKIIEDNACSPVSEYRGKFTGTIGDIGVWSFDAMKILVTGDGGMVYCKDFEKADALGRSIYLGLLSKSGYVNSQDNRWWAFDIDQPGRRAIMNDISSAIGNVQLKKLPGFIERRQEIHHFYDKELKDIPGIELPPALPSNCKSSYYFYRIRLKSAKLRDELAVSLKEKGVYTTFRYYPLHLVPFYQCDKAAFPNANHAALHDLCLPIHQALSQEDVQRVVTYVQELMMPSAEGFLV